MKQLPMVISALLFALGGLCSPGWAGDMKAKMEELKGDTQGQGRGTEGCGGGGQGQYGAGGSGAREGERERGHGASQGQGQGTEGEDRVAAVLPELEGACAGLRFLCKPPLHWLSPTDSDSTALRRTAVAATIASHVTRQRG